VKSVDFSFASIKERAIHRKYTIRQGGEKISPLELRGKLGARQGKGRLAYADAGCTGTMHWRAWAR
jgi:hypothetical protein